MDRHPDSFAQILGAVLFACFLFGALASGGVHCVGGNRWLCFSGIGLYWTLTAGFTMGAVNRLTERWPSRWWSSVGCLVIAVGVARITTYPVEVLNAINGWWTLLHPLRVLPEPPKFQALPYVLGSWSFAMFAPLPLVIPQAVSGFLGERPYSRLSVAIVSVLLAGVLYRVWWVAVMAFVLLSVVVLPVAVLRKLEHILVERTPSVQCARDCKPDVSP